MVTSSAGPTGDSDFAQIGIDPNGALNTGFGNGGIALDGFTGPKQDSGNAVAQQGDGKLIVAGTTSTATGDQLIALARYNTDGSLDTSFGSSGQTTLSVPGIFVDVRGVAVAASGEIYVAFTASTGGNDATTSPSPPSMPMARPTPHWARAASRLSQRPTCATMLLQCACLLTAAAFTSAANKSPNRRSV